MTRVVWTPQAREDLRRIRDYIAEDSLIFSKVFIERLTGSVTRLRRFPKSGRIVPEIGFENIREIIITNYRIVYRVRKELVEILTVFHSSWTLGLRSIES